jgi:hypothetical protein
MLTQNVPVYYVEWLAAVIMAFYIVLPIPTPLSWKPWITSTLGMSVFVIVTVSLFLLQMPVVGFLYMLAVYEMIRRSTQDPTGNVNGDESYYEQLFAYGNTKTSDTVATSTVFVGSNAADKTDEMKKLNPRPQTTLEEEIVRERAPIIKKNAMSEYIETGFMPVADKFGGTAASAV